MFDSIFEDAIALIKKWTPKQSYKKEPEYRDDLLDFLRKQFNENPNPFALQTTKLNLTKEDSRGLCDIGINRKVGIELKKDLKGKSQIDRLVGQVTNYKKDYQDIIIVLVGNTDKESLEQLKGRIPSLVTQNFGLNADQRIKIIDKSPSNIEQKKPQDNMFGFKF